jgi:hypothetical protein
VSERRADAPTLAVVVTGGIGVLVVIAFVAGVVLGRGTRTEPGDRVGVAAVDGELVVFAARCEDERVRAVEVRTPGGPALWRIESDKGTIDRRFVVGGEPPAFFLTTVRLESLPTGGTLEAEVTVDDVVDAKPFDLGALEESDGFGVSCDDRDLGVVPLLFVMGASGVVAAYGAMLARYVRSR